MGDFLTYRSIVFTILNTHPGRRSLWSLALGLVLLPRWGVSLCLCVSPKLFRANRLFVFHPERQTV